MAVSRKLKAIYMGFFEKPELWAANAISNFQEKRSLKKNINKKKKLTSAQKKEIKSFWRPYARISTKWCRYYSVQNGIFDPRYIPNTLYYTKIDQHFNNRKLGYGFNDKNYYSRIFPDIPQPKTLVRKIGLLLFDEDYRQIGVDDAMSIICAEPEIIVKPSQESGSGRGISFLRTENDKNEIKALLEDDKEPNYIIQSIVKQHPALSKIHESSLNTVRIATLMLDDGVHVLSSVCRMGVNASRIDNVTAGGISVGINPDGKFKKYAYTYYTGEKMTQHPQGLVFENYECPSFDKIIETVKRAAQYIGNFRLVSWDMAVDENGEVLLIEANMRKGGINLHQFDNGPLFGDLTERVLKEVFNKK